MDPKELEDLADALYEEGFTDDEVAAELAGLESAEPAKVEATSAKPKDALFSAKTAFPATVEAVRNFPSLGEFAAGAQSQDPQVRGAATAKLTSAPFEVAKGLGQDIAGGIFRLAGSLVPATRGKEDGQTRTFTQSLQNPNASLTTPLDEALDASSLPESVKTIGHIGLGAAQGGAVGALKGGGKAVIAKATAGGREGAGNLMIRTADAVQNLRLGATPKDVLDGYTPRTLARNGLNRLSPQDAWHQTEETMNVLNARARELKGAERVTLDVNQVLNDTREELLSRKFNFNRQQVEDALEEIRTTVAQQAERDGIQATARAPFVPRRPIFQLTPDEIREGITSGEIRFTNRGNRPVPEYARPENVPTNFLPDENAAPELRLNFMDLNTLKTEVGKEAAFQHIAGRVRGDKAASASEKVFNMFYRNLKRSMDPLGGPELRDINRQFSELIPVQNVLARAMTREELGAALGRTDIPTTKFGLVRAAMRATKTDRAVLLNNAGEALQRSGAADASRALGGMVREGAQQSAIMGMLKGSLVGGVRE